MWMIEANGIRGTANVADDVPQVVVKLISYFGRRKNSVEIFQLSFDKGLFLPPSQKVERSSWVSHVVTDDWNDIFNQQLIGLIWKTTNYSVGISDSSCQT